MYLVQFAAIYYLAIDGALQMPYWASTIGLICRDPGLDMLLARAIAVCPEE